jgi:hypothetical protein
MELCTYVLILKGSDDGVLYSGLPSFRTFSLANILKEHNVSETESVSIFRWKGWEAPAQLCQLEGATLNQWTTKVGITASVYAPWIRIYQWEV